MSLVELLGKSGTVLFRSVVSHLLENTTSR